MYQDAHDVWEALNPYASSAAALDISAVAALEQSQLRTIFYSGETLVHRCLQGNHHPEALVRILVQAFPEALLLPGGEEKLLPLHEFLKRGSGSRSLVEWLIAEAPESLLVETADGRLALHVACQCSGCPIDVVDYLVSLDPTAVTHRDRHGRSPLEHLLLGQQRTSRDADAYHRAQQICQRLLAIDASPLMIPIFSPAMKGDDYSTNIGTGTAQCRRPQRRRLVLHHILLEPDQYDAELMNWLLPYLVDACPGAVRVPVGLQQLSLLATACAGDVPLTQLYAVVRAFPEDVRAQLPVTSTTTTTTSAPMVDDFLWPALVPVVARADLEAWVDRYPDTALTTPDAQGRVPLHYCAALASERGSIEDDEAEDETSTSSSSSNDDDERGESSCETKSTANEPNVIQWLLSQAPDAAAVTDRWGRTPLHYAAAAVASSGSDADDLERVVAALAAANPDALHQIDEDGCCPWHYAACGSQGVAFRDWTEPFLSETACLEEDYYDEDLIPDQIRWDVLQWAPLST